MPITISGGVQLTGPVVLTQSSSSSGGLSNGYTSGGDSSAGTDIIDKFPFASDGNASDVGDLTRSCISAAGQQG